MFFVIPEILSKTFVMVLKELPDHFNLRFLHGYTRRFRKYAANSFTHLQTLYILMLMFNLAG